jgi:hypothetical protein
MPSAMRLSETITIYLAAGASFGAYKFLREHSRGSRFYSLLRAMPTMILWPIAAAGILFSRLRLDKDTAEREGAEFIEKIEQAHRTLLASLYQVTELMLSLSGVERAKVERASSAVREATEKYVGLTVAAAECNPAAHPSEREKELYRVAGRRGDDLLLAARCIHRRNAARLIAHQARSRTELLHALAEIRETRVNANSLEDTARARHASVGIMRFYSHAFNLLSLLEDETAAARVARLMDAECSRLRRLEALSLKETRDNEEELCRTHQARHPAFTAS